MLGLGCSDALRRAPEALRALLPGVLATIPLAGVRGALRAECGVPGTGGESVGLTTPGELPLAPCTGLDIADEDISQTSFLVS